MASDAQEQAAQLEQLFRLLAAARTTTSLSIAGLVLIIYDHILTFADEVEHVWKTRFSPANLFYIWASLLRFEPPGADDNAAQIRYFTLITMIINVVFLLEVEDSDKFQSATSTLVIISADLVLAIRVWILYRKSHNLLWILFPLVGAEMISMLIVGYLSIRPLRDFVHVGSLVHGCYSMEVPRLLTYYSLPLLVVACIMFILTMYKCGMTIHALGFGRTPLLELFLRDGVFWFLASALCCITDIVIWSWGPAELARTPIIFTTGLLSVVGTRVLMNIKSAMAVADGPSASEGTAVLTIGSTVFRRETRETRTPFERLPMRRATNPIASDAYGHVSSDASVVLQSSAGPRHYESDW